jgi:hypothetical protein
VKKGLLPGLIVALGFVAIVFWKLPADARMVERAAVVLMGAAIVALSAMILERRA